MRITKKNIADAFKDYLRASKSAPPNASDSIYEVVRAAENSRGAARHGLVDAALVAVNSMIGGYGVEAIRGRWHDRYYQDIVGLYVNTGDTYNVTLVYDTVEDEFIITTMGDFVEETTEEYEIQ